MGLCVGFVDFGCDYQCKILQLSQGLKSSGRRSSRYLALLRSLVSPRDRARAPDRSTETMHEGKGGHWGDRECIRSKTSSFWCTTSQSKECCDQRRGRLRLCMDQCVCVLIEEEDRGRLITTLFAGLYHVWNIVSALLCFGA